MRLKADFNGLFGDVLCLSHGDTCEDETGATVTLRAGMAVTAFDLDSDDQDQPDDLIASGMVEPSPDWLQCNGSKWCLRIDANGVRHQSDLKWASILAVVGLKREAKIVSRAGVTVAVGRAVETAIGPDTRGVISIGIAGALAGSLGIGDPVIGRSVVTGDESFAADDAWTSALVRKLRLGTPEVAIAGMDEIAASPTAKAALHAGLPQAFAVDMESHIAARAAAARGIPFAALRVISDTSTQSLPPAALVAMTPDGGIAYGRVLLSVLTRPTQIPELIRTGRRADQAFAALEHCVAMLGPGLGFPY